MTFAQRRNRITTHSSERIPVLQRRISVQLTAYHEAVSRVAVPSSARTLVTPCTGVPWFLVAQTVHLILRLRRWLGCSYIIYIYIYTRIDSCKFPSLTPMRRNLTSFTHFTTCGGQTRGKMQLNSERRSSYRTVL
jgi:hypothetical protein